MNRGMDELANRIEVFTKKLEALREEFDRLDANHPHRSVQINQDIKECSDHLETLIRFQKNMKGGQDE